MTTEKKWPRLKGDYKGLRVRIVKQLNTNGGDGAEAGATATVVGYHRGLELRVDVCDKCGTKTYIKRVPESSVELI